MNKKSLIILLAIVIIICLAIFTGAKLSKKDSKDVSVNPDNSENATTLPEEQTTPEVTPETDETPTVNETTTPTVEKTPTAPVTKDISKLSGKEKEEYAKEIAKSAWEKLGIDIKVYYSCDQTLSSTEYEIVVREESTTNQLLTYKINISTATYEVVEDMYSFYQ